MFMKVPSFLFALNQIDLIMDIDLGDAGQSVKIRNLGLKMRPPESLHFFHETA